MRYQVGGSLGGNDPTYVVRTADEQLYVGLKTGDFCYVFNSRQMGKSSLLQRTSNRLKQEGYACVYLDVSRLGSDETTLVQWYKGITLSLFHSLDLAQHVNFKDWWQELAELSPVQRLHQFVEEVLLVYVQDPRIFIFIDEIDSLLSLSFKVDDFFVWIRHCYNLRSHNSNFERLGIALFGVASPSDLIADKLRTPFNIGKAIELHGFQLHEATPLLQGLEEAVSSSIAVLQSIIYWTGGQPFLTQKLCQLVIKVARETSTRMITLPVGTEAYWVEQLVRSRIIQHWESHDSPEHLRTIRDRLLLNEQNAGRLLGLYQRVLLAESVDSEKVLEWKSLGVVSGSDGQITPDLLVPTDDSREQTELLLCGVVEKQNGYLRVKNLIYRNVFNTQWVVRQLNNLRPYSQTFNAWIASDYLDESRLLRGQALREVLHWTQGKSLSDLDYKFLTASQELEHQEVEQKLKAEHLKEVEARLAQERKSSRRQRRLLVAMSLALVAAIILGIFALSAYRQAAVNEIQALEACFQW